MFIEMLNGNVKYSYEKTEYQYNNDRYTFLFDVNYDRNKDFLNDPMNGNSVLLNMLSNDCSVEQVHKLIVGGFFIVRIDKSSLDITVFRDISGIKSGYFFNEKDKVIVGTNVHAVAKSAGILSFNQIITDMLLMKSFVPDGETIYLSVYEVKIGGKIGFNRTGDITVNTHESLNLSNVESSDSRDSIIVKTREIISNMFKNHASNKNIVYLSGGIDSCVMLAALEETLGRSKVHSISYKVKGTNQDETPYAKSVANYLGISNDVIEVDPNDNCIGVNFKEKILNMNNPYYGIAIFSPDKPDLYSTFFAGQDTRLLSPAVNRVDRIVFNRILSEKKYRCLNNGGGGGVYRKFKKWYDSRNLFNSKNRIIRNLDRIVCLLYPDEYIKKYFYGLYPAKLMADSSPMDNFDIISKYYGIDLSGVLSEREIYNRIVAIKWKEQYTDDIRYMQDMAKLSGTYIQMPFYDLDFARFAASVPFNFASEFVKGKDAYGSKTKSINKILLREAYKDKLSDDVFFRNKAVSMTAHQFFNGAFRKIISDIFIDDINSKDSFINNYGYNNIYEKFFNMESFGQNQHSLMLKIWYLACLCVYNENLNLKH